MTYANQTTETDTQENDFYLVLSAVAMQVVPTNNGFGTFFLYESAKDVLRWNNLSVKEYIKLIMYAGTMIFITDKEFNELNQEEVNLNMTDLEDMYS